MLNKESIKKETKKSLINDLRKKLLDIAFEFKNSNATFKFFLKKC